MDHGTTTETTPLQEARIVQASVMDESSVLLTFSNGFSALVNCADLKQLVVSGGAMVIHDDDVAD